MLEIILIGALITLIVLVVVLVGIIIWYRNYRKHDQERVDRIVEKVRAELENE